MEDGLAQRRARARRERGGGAAGARLQRAQRAAHQLPRVLIVASASNHKYELSSITLNFGAKFCRYLMLRLSLSESFERPENSNISVSVISSPKSLSGLAIIYRGQTTIQQIQVALSCN